MNDHIEQARDLIDKGYVSGVSVFELAEKIREAQEKTRQKNNESRQEGR